MLVLVILIALVVGGIGVYAAQNPTLHDVTIWQYHWTGVPTWVPAAAAGLGVALAFLIYMLYAGVRSGIRHGSLRLRLATRDTTIGDLRRENQVLREENARLRSENRPAGYPAVAPMESGAPTHLARGRPAP